MWQQRGVWERLGRVVLALGLSAVALGCSERNPLLDRDDDAIFADPARAPMDAGGPPPTGPGPDSPDAHTPVPRDATVATNTVVDGVCLERALDCEGHECSYVEVVPRPRCSSAGSVTFPAEGYCGPFLVQYVGDDGYRFWDDKTGELLGRYRTSATARFCGRRAFALVEGFVPNPDLHCPGGVSYRCACDLDQAQADDLDAGDPGSACDPGPIDAVLKPSLFSALGLR